MVPPITPANKIDHSVLGPIIYLFSPEWSILLAGVIGGTIAYLVGEHSVS